MELFEETFGALLTVKELKQCKSRVYRKWQTLAIIREISYSNLETGRYGPKSGVSRIIRESWQYWLPRLSLCLSKAVDIKMIF